MDKRLLVFNVYYAPQSFGGATIVAEEVTALLSSEHGWQVLVLTSHCDPSVPDYTTRRYKAKGVDIVSVNVPSELDQEQQYRNSEFARVVGEVVAIYQPSLAHVHATQNIGCGYFTVLREAEVPIVVTLHDCWWLCERLFMIASDGRYCHQTRIDPRRCAYCVDNPRLHGARDNYLRGTLAKADLLLAPSEFHRSIYLANGIDGRQCIVNKNGVRFPAADFRKRKRADDKVVFGFVGGPGPIKGADLLLEAFRSLPEHDRYALHVVDAAKNAGTTWDIGRYWEIPGEFKFLPPFDQGTMDDFYGGIDVLLFPSQWKESFGLTVREALLRDVWVIATEAGGVVEDLRHGENATVIPMDGQAGALAAAIQGCLDKASGWANYHNGYKSDVVGFAQQASEVNVAMERLLPGRNAAFGNPAS